MTSVQAETIRDGAWAVRGLLTASECEKLRSAALEAGMQHVANGGASKTLRDCTRVELRDEALAARMWERLRALVPNKVTLDETGEELGLPQDVELRGDWIAMGLNPHIRVCAYPGDGVGHFAPHRDGAYTQDSDTRSLLTVNGYLNALPEGVGGRTRFLVNDLSIHYDDKGRLAVENPARSVTHAVLPDEPGMAVVFFHGQMHDGEPLAAGAPEKWIFRSDVMYQRDPSSVPKEALLNEVGREARAACVEAEDLEREDPTAAAKLYSLAERITDGRIQPAAARAARAAITARASQGGRAGAS